jgi:phage terminase small subunit
MKRKLKTDKEIVLKENEALSEKLELTEKQKAFCKEYIFDWNATRSYLAAYPNVNNADTAGAAASRLLGNVKIQAYITEIQCNLEKLAGLSRLKVINEHMKLAFSSIAHLHNTWIKRKEFEYLTEDQKACIAEIDSKVKTEYAFDPDNPKEKKPLEVEYVRVKLYDKQKALDSISKMLGYDAPSKMQIDVDVKDMPDIIIKSDD